MPSRFWKAGHSRRELFRQGGLLTAALSPGGRIRRAAAAPLEYGANLYRSIGVRPLLNACGTFTIITGSQTLAEVNRPQASRSLSPGRLDGRETPVPERRAAGRVNDWFEAVSEGRPA